MNFFVGWGEVKESRRACRDADFHPSLEAPTTSPHWCYVLGLSICAERLQRPDLRYLATGLWIYSISTGLPTGLPKLITVGWGLWPIRLEYKKRTLFFFQQLKTQDSWACFHAHIKSVILRQQLQLKDTRPTNARTCRNHVMKGHSFSCSFEHKRKPLTNPFRT